MVVVASRWVVLFIAVRLYKTYSTQPAANIFVSCLLSLLYPSRPSPPLFLPPSGRNLGYRWVLVTPPRTGHTPRLRIPCKAALRHHPFAVIHRSICAVLAEDVYLFAASSFICPRSVCIVGIAPTLHTCTYMLGWAGGAGSAGFVVSTLECYPRGSTR